MKKKYTKRRSQPKRTPFIKFIIFFFTKFHRMYPHTHTQLIIINRKNLDSYAHTLHLCVVKVPQSISQEYMFSKSIIFNGLLPFLCVCAYASFFSCRVSSLIWLYQSRCLDFFCIYIYREILEQHFWWIHIHFLKRI